MAVSIKTPPKRKRRGPKPVKWAGVVEFLKKHPGEFATVGEYSVGVAPSIRRGEYLAFLPEDFDGDAKEYMKEHYEVVTSIVTREPTVRSEVFIRWLG